MDPSELPPPTPVFRLAELCPHCFGAPLVRLKTEMVLYLYCPECEQEWTTENPDPFHRPPPKLKPRA